MGDLLSALERIFCAEGQLKLLGDLGTRCCTFLGSGTTTPEARSLVGGNMSGFPQFWKILNLFNPKLAFGAGVFEILRVSRYS